MGTTTMKLSVTRHLILSLTILLFGSINALQAQMSLSFSAERGFYNAPFQLNITASDPTAIIKYTVDGDNPSTINGSIYNGAIAVSTTTVVKALAYNSIDTTSVIAHSYIYLNDVVNQMGTPTGYPDTWTVGPIESFLGTLITTGDQIGDYDMDPNVVNDPQYANDIIDGLLQIPTVSVSTSVNDLFTPSSGIYSNTLDTVNEERLISIEMFNPDGSTEFMTNAGIKISGASSRYPDFNKHAFRVSFRSQYGPKKLKHPVFGSDGTDEFDALVLRMFGHCSPHDSNEGRRDNSQLEKDQFARELQLAMGDNSPRSKFVHLYLNGLYWGMYNLTERPDGDFHASYNGGSEEDYDVLNTLRIKDGDTIAYHHMFDISNDAVTTQVQWDSIQAYLDIDAFANYMMLNHYIINTDWDENNWWAGRKREAGAGFQYYVWDAEWAFNYQGYQAWVVNKDNTPHPSGLHRDLVLYPEYKVRYGDRVQCNCIEADGPLNPANAIPHYLSLSASIDKAYLGELARWGDTRGGATVDYNQHVIPFRDHIVNDILPNQVNVLLDRYAIPAYSLYPVGIDAVQYSQLGGLVVGGISLTNPNAFGDIYYTIDGSDPRLEGGAINPAAILYTGANINIGGVAVVKSRVYNSGTNAWSAMCPRTFYTNQDYQNIVINEIHYNPPSVGIIDGDEFEFIELKNNGSSIVDLSDVYFGDGIQYKFPIGTTIQPGGFTVLAENELEFSNYNGQTAFDQYSGKLSNGGETVLLKDPFGAVIDSVTYDDMPPWPTEPDSTGPSLSLLDANLDNALASSWKAAVGPNTPNAENVFCIPMTISLFPTAATCANSNDGSINSLVFGGIGPFNYSWNNGQNAATATGLNPGTYVLSVTDSSNCTETMQVTVGGPTPIVAAVTTNNETAAGNADGSANINVSGGNSPYNIVWSNGNTGTLATGLTAGNYTVTVTDNLNCTQTESFTISTQAACTVPNGITTLSQTGDSGTLTWAAVPSATNYIINFRATGAANWNTINSQYNFVIISGLTNCTQYEYRVQGVCGVGNNSAFSAIQTFTTTGCSQPCEAIQGLFSTNETVSSAFLNWDIYPGAGYTIHYRAVGNPTWLNYNTNISLLILFGLNSCTTYEWYVVTNCPDGSTSPDSPIVSFTTGGCKNGSEENNEAQISNLIASSINLYPNPTKDYFYISNQPLQFEDGAVVSINDVAGRQIQTQIINSSSEQILVNNIETGIYMITIEWAGQITTSQLRVIR